MVKTNYMRAIPEKFQIEDKLDNDVLVYSTMTRTRESVTSLVIDIDHAI